MREKAAYDKAGGEGDRDALEWLGEDLPLNSTGRAAPHPIKRVLQFGEIVLDGFDCNVPLHVTVGSLHDDTLPLSIVTLIDKTAA
jgi:hypothetical protein